MPLTETCSVSQTASLGLWDSCISPADQTLWKPRLPHRDQLGEACAQARLRVGVNSSVPKRSNSVCWAVHANAYPGNFLESEAWHAAGEIFPCFPSFCTWRDMPLSRCVKAATESSRRHRKWQPNTCWHIHPSLLSSKSRCRKSRGVRAPAFSLHFPWGVPRTFVCVAGARGWRGGSLVKWAQGIMD